MRTLVKATLLPLLSTFVLAQPAQQQTYDNRILVVLKPDVVIDEVDNRGTFPITGLASLDQLLGSREIVKMEKYLPSATPDDRDGDIILSNIYRVILGPKQPAKYAITEFREDRNILFAESEAINRRQHIPNDTEYPNQWHLPKIGAPEAWDFWDIAGGSIPGNTRDEEIVLASVDDGVDYTHPDLWKNIWVNQGEIPTDIIFNVDQNLDLKITPQEIVDYIDDYNGDGVTNLQDALHSSSPFMNGVDDNNNSTQYVDDLLGWDVAGANTGPDEDNDPMPRTNDSHGTHVAGILAATTGNNEGVASVTYNGSIMSVKGAVDSDGSLWNMYAGMLYAAKAGADIVNCSWGSSGHSTSNQSVVNVLVNTYGAIVVGAAGNGNDDGTPTDRPHYPSGYDNVVSVTAVGPSDNFGWANYGADAGDGKFHGIDISAPGEGILSTVVSYSPLTIYEAWDGTSMASPLVASCIGLLKAANPSKSNDWLIETIKTTADPIDHLNPNYAGQLGSGRVNIYNALARNKLPSLSYTGQGLDVIDNDGDGRLTPGEEGTLTVALSNEVGWDPATGVSAILRSGSEYMSILDSTATFADILAGEQQSNLSDPFSISLAQNAPSGNFTLILEVTANEGDAHPYQETFEFTVENIRWQSGFPQLSATIKSGSAVVDLDGDGNKETIYVAADSMLHVKQADGTAFPGFPVAFNHKSEASPAVGDLDGDDDLEIVAVSWDRGVYVVQHDGSSESIYQASNIILAPPALHDLDQDGDMEIVILSYAKQIVALHHDGTLLPNFPVDVTGYLKVGAAIGDVNADGSPDIIVPTLDKKLHALNVDGSSLAGFPVTVGQPIESAPALVNLDDDVTGTLEILIGSDASALHAYDAAGTEIWKTTVGGKVRTDPAVADVDGDGDLEIAFGAADRGVYLLDHEGTILSGWPVYTEGVIYSSPVIADLDLDGTAEIFLGDTDYKLYGLKPDGSRYFAFPVEHYASIQSSPTLADLDGDGDVELIVGTAEELAVTDLNVTASVLNFWPTHRGNLHRTGTATTMIPVSVDGIEQVPSEFALIGNYPNPFNASTQIKFNLTTPGHVKLEIIDIRGRVRETLIDATMDPGTHRFPWNAMLSGEIADAGVYLYRLTTPSGSMIRKMTLLK